MAPYKERFFDPVHGFIHLSEAEKQLLDHPAFVRLHYLHQLGLTYLVYPGATHSRFEHSLGVMHLATQIYDSLFEQPDDILKQALRLGALCHDLGHLPFSHTLEESVLGSKGHEYKTLEMIRWLATEKVFTDYEQKYPGFLNLVMKIAVSRSVYQEAHLDEYTELEQLLAQIVSGDYFGADRIDYLMRDSQSTGVSVGLFDFPQLIEMLKVVMVGDRPVLALKQEGLHAAEGLLLARHYMHLRVYKHPGVLAYNQALEQLMQKIEPINFKHLSPSGYVRYTDVWLSAIFMQLGDDPGHVAHPEALILMRRSPRFKTIHPPQPPQPPGPLQVLTKEGVVETLYPLSFHEGFFKKVL